MQRRSEERRIRREGHSQPPTATTSPDALLARVELLRRVEQLVAELDEPFRGTVLAHYFEDLSAAEIARQQRIPAATVRSRLKTGLERIRTALDRQTGGERSAWCLALAPLHAPSKGGLASTAIAMKLSSVLSLAAILGAVALAVGAAIVLSEPETESPRVSVSSPASQPLASSSAEPSDAGLVSRRLPPVGTPATLQRFANPRARGIMLERLQRARARRLVAEADTRQPSRSSPTSTPSTVTDEIGYALITQIEDHYMPLAQECLALVPGNEGGPYLFEYRVSTEPEVGGLIEEVEISPLGDANRAPEVLECLTESLYTLELPPTSEPFSNRLTLEIMLEPGAAESSSPSG